MKLSFTRSELNAFLLGHFNLPSNTEVEITSDKLSESELKGIRLVESFLPANKIGAIKEYRAIAGCGLKEAKDVVENWHTAVSAMKEQGHLVIPTYDRNDGRIIGWE